MMAFMSILEFELDKDIELCQIPICSNGNKSTINQNLFSNNFTFF